MSEPETQVKTCYLNDSPTGDTDNATLDLDLPFVQSPYMTRGIGRISFWYKTWENDGDPPATIYLRSSPVGTNIWSTWNEIGVITNVANTNYTYFTTNVYITDDYYLRIYCETNQATARACIDNVLIAEPIGADVDILDVTLHPEIPLTNDYVTLSANLDNFFLSPSNIKMRMYYNIGTNDWGDWDTNDWLSMTNNGLNTYVTDGAIPPQGIDTVVQYHVACTFEGLFAEKASPKEHKEFTNPTWYYPVDLNLSMNAGQPQTNPNPYYVVFSCLPGDVWINEINVVDEISGSLIYTNQYLELCGKTDSDIGNWQIQVLRTTFATTAIYKISSATVIQDETNGFGFWAIGSNGVQNMDMYLTNMLPENGGIRLFRSMGASETNLCYGWQQGAKDMPDNPDYHFVYIGYDDDFSAAPLALTGTGSNVFDFVWTNTGLAYTPGWANDGQTLLGENNEPTPVEIEIVDLMLTDTNIWVGFTSTDTGGLLHTLFSCSNLVEENSWYSLTNYPPPVSTDDTNWFYIPIPGAPLFRFYKIVATNAP